MKLFEIGPTDCLLSGAKTLAAGARWGIKKAKYGIRVEDSYNFDESGFMMGVIPSQQLVTGSR